MALDPPSPEPTQSADADLGSSGTPARRPKPGSSAEVAVQIGQLDFSKPRSEFSTSDGEERPPRDVGAMWSRANRANSGVSWPFVILGSYASAVTLALVWVLATGKTLPRHRAYPISREAEARPPAASRAPAPIPADRSVSLGKTLIVGDLEIMPLMVLRKTVRAPANADAEQGGREIRGCLSLTLRLKNLSAGLALKPMGPSNAETGDAGAPPYLEMGTGERVAMLDLSNTEGEPIDEQASSTIAPGAVADIVFLSEPAPSERLIGPFTWWITLKTGGDEPTTIGVRFSRREIDEVGG